MVPHVAAFMVEPSSLQCLIALYGTLPKQ